MPDRPAGLRYAEPVAAPGGREVWCVLEEFTGDGATDVTRLLAAVPLDGSAAEDPDAVRELADDRHFLTGPRLSPDGRRLAWIAWDHPDMPWDGTELRVADDRRATARSGRARTVAGGPEESVAQGAWLDATTLAIVSDRDGWWNLHRVERDDRTGRRPVPAEEEFGGPLWKIGGAGSRRWTTG